MQKFLNNKDAFIKLLLSFNPRRIFVVHGSSYKHMSIKSSIEESVVPITDFTSFGVNPRFEEVSEATRIFSDSNADVIVAVGGGSAIDTAKYIKFNHPTVPLVAVPTTAGSGSESTSFAVHYRNREKQSIMDDSLLPDYVLLMPEVLSGLPLAQKHSTFADALCQAIEAWWSVNATRESIKYSRQAIAHLLPNADAYFSNDTDAFPIVMQGSNYAGRAINIAKTTAAHAMSYKITSDFGLSHGYAVALCLPAVWEFMNATVLKGSTLEQTLDDISTALGCKRAKEAPGMLQKLFSSWNIVSPCGVTSKKITDMAQAVNLERLKNFPVKMNAEAATTVYENIFWRTTH